ncbi:MAG: tRNA (adenosine(37)-N6)-threonylcarbamoyltransferase complex ATPase subunit type 1 TsaE [Candidatus Omnitrophica bacterium]|nr:tRNA (adenosine(37)-N6)-threonylcarbamoyltransferase complex ATPase subunit type 1 TsaE [Candidatus Omnitrophota bacterium]
MNLPPQREPQIAIPATPRKEVPAIISHSADETMEIGAAWGREARAGWLIGLSGELGAGKTQLVKGLARGLGVTSGVYSPSFALVNEYQGGRLPLFHLDLYRLETPAQMLAAGLEEDLFHPAGVTVVEWIERWFIPNSELPGRQRGSAGAHRFLRWVRIGGISPTERRITYEDFGD